jgi:hypothetical protein
VSKGGEFVARRRGRRHSGRQIPFGDSAHRPVEPPERAHNAAMLPQTQRHGSDDDPRRRTGDGSSRGAPLALGGGLTGFDAVARQGGRSADARQRRVHRAPGGPGVIWVPRRRQGVRDVNRDGVRRVVGEVGYVQLELVRRLKFVQSAGPMGRIKIEQRLGGGEMRADFEKPAQPAVAVECDAVVLPKPVEAPQRRHRQQQEPGDHRGDLQPHLAAERHGVRFSSIIIKRAARESSPRLAPPVFNRAAGGGFPPPNP